MSNNEFEKQVQQKMEELRFKPSEPVWMEVEKQIRKRKDRRRVLIWFFFGALLIGGAGAWFYANNKTMENAVAIESNNKISNNNNSTNQSGTTTIDQNSTKPEQSSTQNVTSGTTPGTRGTADDNQDADAGAVTTNQDKDASKVRSEVNEATSPKKKDDNNTVASNPEGVQKSAPILSRSNTDKENQHSLKKNNAIVSSNKRVKDKKTSDAGNSDLYTVAKGKKQSTQKNSSDKETGELVVITDDGSKDVANSKQQEHDKIVETQKTDEIKAVDIAVPQTDSNIVATVEPKKTDSLSNPVASAPKKKQDSKKKWEYGFSVHGGFSNISEGIGAIFTPAYADNLYASPNASNISNGVGLITLPPSDVKGGAAFGFGIDVKRSLGKRWWVTTGLRYSYASTRIKVGSKVDSTALLYFSNTFSSRSVGNYYQNSYQADAGYNYTNAFHFLQVPVGVEKQLGKKSRFLLSTGVSLSYLLSTTVLHYNNAKNVYFKDNNLVNKMQLNFDAGLSYRVIQQKKISIKVGPQIQYGLTNIFKKSEYGSRHLLSAGIGAQIIFHKK